MKKTTIAVALVAVFGLSACSSTKQTNVGSGGAVPPGAQQAISEQRLASDFKRQGIRVIYTWTGNIEAIETTGYAAVWGSSQNAAREAFRVAELEAKKSLNDFINHETIQSTTSVTMISRNIEKARDSKTNNFATNRSPDSDVITSDEEVSGSSANKETNLAVRNDALNIASRVRTNINVRSSGILGGLYLKEGEVINGGRNVRVVYRWDAKHVETRTQVRSMMAQ